MHSGWYQYMHSGCCFVWQGLVGLDGHNNWSEDSARWRKMYKDLEQQFSCKSCSGYVWGMVLPTYGWSMTHCTSPTRHWWMCRVAVAKYLHWISRSTVVGEELLLIAPGGWLVYPHISKNWIRGLRRQISWYHSGERSLTRDSFRMTYLWWNAQTLRGNYVWLSPCVIYMCRFCIVWVSCLIACKRTNHECSFLKCFTEQRLKILCVWIVHAGAPEVNLFSKICIATGLSTWETSPESLVGWRLAIVTIITTAGFLAVREHMQTSQAVFCQTMPHSACGSLFTAL